MSPFTSSPRTRCRCTPDPLVHHGRHFGRTVHAMTKIQALLTNGLLRTAELDESPDEQFTAECVRYAYGVYNVTRLDSVRERKEHRVFTKLLQMVPGLLDRLMNGTEEEVIFVAELVCFGPPLPSASAHVVPQIQKGASSARSDDTKGLKGAVLDWITPKGQPLNPALSRNVKIDRGFHHECTGALLCPAELDWSNAE
jgi:hypothetical protein